MCVRDRESEIVAKKIYDFWLHTWDARDGFDVGAIRSCQEEEKKKKPNEPRRTRKSSNPDKLPTKKK